MKRNKNVYVDWDQTATDLQNNILPLLFLSHCTNNIFNDVNEIYKFIKNEFWYVR